MDYISFVCRPQNKFSPASAPKMLNKMVVSPLSAVGRLNEKQLKMIELLYNVTRADSSLRDWLYKSMALRRFMEVWCFPLLLLGGLSAQSVDFLYLHNESVICGLTECFWWYHPKNVTNCFDRSRGQKPIWSSPLIGPAKFLFRSRLN